MVNSETEDRFALQRLYEKWIKKAEWLLEQEAIPLLLGEEPESEMSESVAAKVVALSDRLRRELAADRLKIRVDENNSDLYWVSPCATARSEALPLYCGDSRSHYLAWRRCSVYRSVCRAAASV